MAINSMSYLTGKLLSIMEEMDDFNKVFAELQENKQWPGNCSHDALTNTCERMDFCMRVLAWCVVEKTVEVVYGKGPLGCVNINMLTKDKFDAECVVMLTHVQGTNLFANSVNLGSQVVYSWINTLGYKPVFDGTTRQHNLNKYVYRSAQNHLPTLADKKVEGFNRRLKRKHFRQLDAERAAGGAGN